MSLIQIGIKGPCLNAVCFEIAHYSVPIFAKNFSVQGDLARLNVDRKECYAADTFEPLGIPIIDRTDVAEALGNTLQLCHTKGGLEVCEAKIESQICISRVDYVSNPMAAQEAEPLLSLFATSDYETALTCGN
jgi:hypothetical protein